MKAKALLLAALIAVSIAPAAKASLAYNFASLTPGNGANTPAESLGFEFITGSNILTVNALAFFDLNSSGLAFDHEVGIYDAFGDLLVSTIVLTTDPIVDSFNYDTLLTPYDLQPNTTYIIAAETGPDSSDFFTWSPNGSFDPGITFVTDLFSASTSLTFPTTTDTNTGLFGPNFEFTTGGESVPEPSAGILVGTALLILAFFRPLRKLAQRRASL
jgi:hypothetical protein